MRTAASPRPVDVGLRSRSTGAPDPDDRAERRSPVHVQHVDGSDHPYTLDGVGYSAHTPEDMFTVIRQVNGPDHGPLGTLWRPKYFTWTGIAVHGYTSVPPYPASHGCTRVDGRHELDLGVEQHADRHTGLGVLTS